MKELHDVSEQEWSDSSCSFLVGSTRQKQKENSLELCPCSKDSMKNTARECAQVPSWEQFRNEPKKKPGEEQQGSWNHSPTGDS